ncbi:hypothetical protein LJR027_002647 [Terrabacter sp. LjRoot27]|uniref:hypothetical protein n=1 Tax=Terrabacter sp. LjRoot27 TaxID=3342306 RepID=UPI003ED1185B
MGISRVGRGLAIIAAAGLGVALTTTAQAATPDDMHYPAANLTYAPVDIGARGVQYTHVTGINSTGTIVGDYGDKQGQHGFVNDQGSIKVVNVPRAKRTVLTSINDVGTVTGVYWNAGSPIEHGFVQTAAGAFTPLDDVAAQSTRKRDVWGTVPEGINNAGLVVGYYFTTTPNGAVCGDTACDKTVAHGFTWTEGSFTTYDPPDVGTQDNPRTGTRLFDVSNSDVVVGSYLYLAPFAGEPDPVGVTPGFRMDPSGGSFSTFVDPGFPANWCWSTTPSAVNASGTVAGLTVNGCGMSDVAWLLPAGDSTFASATEVFYPGSTYTEVGDLNDAGVVVGSWTDVDGRDHGFIAPPE